MRVLYLLSAVRCVYSECLFKIDLAIIGLDHLGKVSHLEEEKNGWRFVCLRVIQKSLLISSLVVECFFRKGSVFDMFEALCETSKTIWNNWKWQLCSEHMALFSLLYNAGGMQIIPLVSCLSQVHIFYLVL